jgi:hypothetical protein
LGASVISSTVARLERRLRRRGFAHIQLGRLAGDQEKLRVDGAQQRQWSYDEAKAKYATAGDRSRTTRDDLQAAGHA